MAAPSVELLYVRTGVGPFVFLDAKESKDGAPIRWGKKECPPKYAVIRLYDTRLRDLPPEMLERGSGTSRYKINEDAMSVDERTLFNDPARFDWPVQPVKHTIDRNRLAVITVDDSDAWFDFQAQLASEIAAARAAEGL